MDLDLFLWLIGISLTLSVFAVKLGVALGLSKLPSRTLALVLLSYSFIFFIISFIAKPLYSLLIRILLKGPYLHLLLSTGLILWGLYLLTKRSFNDQEVTSLKLSLPLLLPCPVCLSAMAFSAVAFLNATKLPAYLVGLGLSLIFVLLSLVFSLIVRIWAKEIRLATLGFFMIGIGAYLSLSFVVPEKIEEAKRIYKTFASEELIFTPYTLPIFLNLFLVFLFGFLVKPPRVKIKKGV